MAIRIPSGKIFDTQNPKIRDNYIDRLEVECKTVKPDNEFEVSVYNQELNFYETETLPNNESPYTDAYALNQGGGTQRNIRVACNSQGKYGIYTIPQILIPKVSNNHFVSKIYSGLNEDSEDRIKLSARYKLVVEHGVGSYVPSTNLFDYDGVLNKIDEKTFYGLETLDYSIDISNDLPILDVSSIHDLQAYHSVKGENNNLVFSAYVRANSNNNWQPTIVTVNAQLSNPIKDVVFGVDDVVINGVDYYRLTNVKFVINAEILMGCFLRENTKDFSSITGNMSGAIISKMSIVCEKLDITVYGDTIGISLKDESIVFGDANGENPYSISGNELVQTNGTIVDNFGYLVPEYSNGKESATLLCAVGEYYDFDTHALVISTKRNGMPMVFNHYDEVIPMVYGTDGRDRPMSRYPDGSAKVFKVLGVEMMYNGAVWQKLYLQEV